MYFFKAREQTKYFSFDNPDLSGAKRAVASSIGADRRNSRSELIEAKRPFRRRSSESRLLDVAKMKTRSLLSRRCSSDKQYTRLRTNRLDENREDSKVDEVYRGLKRRMAICEQLEKCILDGDRTLYRLRKHMVICSRLHEYSLIPAPHYDAYHWIIDCELVSLSGSKELGILPQISRSASVSPSRTGMRDGPANLVAGNLMAVCQRIEL